MTSKPSSPKTDRSRGGKPRHARFVFFGGKGGVGKTTCAAAWAVAAAAPGRRVLVVSTDPAHSLGDALGVRLSARATSVRVNGGRGRRPRLDALELDSPCAFSRWLRAHRDALSDALEHGTWLDRDDVEALLELPIPGIDELIGLLEIARLAAGYDLIVVDTAPTGHTLRLLGAPEAVAGVAELLDTLQHRHRVIHERLAGVVRPEASDRLIALLARQAQDIGALLRDEARSALHWVLLPEALSLAETEDARAALDRAGIPVAEIIVNRVLTAGPSCALCDRKRKTEATVIKRVQRSFGRRSVHIAYEQVSEPRGVDRLVTFATQLTNRRVPTMALSRPALSIDRSRVSTALTPPEQVHAFQGARLLMFGGKGGVGKTTCAAAVALRLANARPDERILLLSVDPAHSLADVFDTAIGDRTRTIPGAPRNLEVRELDAPAALGAHRLKLEAALAEMTPVLGSDAHRASGGQSLDGLMELAPPGIDELLGILAIADLVAASSRRDDNTSPARRRRTPQTREYDLVIIDTAPTGHALRLLELPGLAREWVHALLQMLLKYRRVVRPGDLAAELVSLAHSIHRLQDLLHRPDAARFAIVTRAAELPRLETERLFARLRALKIATPALIVNAVTVEPDSCPRCLAHAAAEAGEIALLATTVHRRAKECAIILTPTVAPPPRGSTGLDRWAKRWSVRVSP